MWFTIGTDCLDRLWKLKPQMVLEADYINTSPKCLDRDDPVFEQRAGLDDLPRLLLALLLSYSLSAIRTNPGNKNTILKMLSNNLANTKNENSYYRNKNDQIYAVITAQGKNRK